MKKILLSIVAIVLNALCSFGQAPEGFKYQAVVRDAGNTILNNQAVGMRMTIQQGLIGGTAVYQETFSPTTNAYGLVNLEIGSGTVVSGDFGTIEWANGPYFIETAVDVTGGTNYVVMGTSQLLSVPYALHANTAEKITGNCEISIGDTYQGGIVFYVDHTGCHGLIAADADQSTGTYWIQSAFLTGVSYATGFGLYEGMFNTERINFFYPDVTGSAAGMCRDLILNGHDDWYLPSIMELELMYKNIGQGNTNGMGNVGGFADAAYWSSTEAGLNDAWVRGFDMGVGSWGTIEKVLFQDIHVRAIRAF